VENCSISLPQRPTTKAEPLSTTQLKSLHLSVKFPVAQVVVVAQPAIPAVVTAQSAILAVVTAQLLKLSLNPTATLTKLLSSKNLIFNSRQVNLNEKVNKGKKQFSCCFKICFEEIVLLSHKNFRIF
jgi:hypothetical protein